MTTNSNLSLTLVAVSALLLCSVNAQDAPSQLVQAVNDLKVQQAQIADNQAKIDSKIADLGETIRVARLFMSRGGRHKLPSKK